MQLTGSPLLLTALVIFLAVAAAEDLARQRISNVLTFGAALLGLTLQFFIGGFSGLVSGLGGLGVGLVVFLPFFLLRKMGAGDVKAMAAAGAFLAPLPSLLATGLTLIAGTVLGVAVLAVRGGLAATLQRLGLNFMCVVSGGATPEESPAGTAKVLRFPYAVAIAVGTVSAVGWLKFH